MIEVEVSVGAIHDLMSCRSSDSWRGGVHRQAEARSGDRRVGCGVKDGRLHIEAFGGRLKSP